MISFILNNVPLVAWYPISIQIGFWQMLLRKHMKTLYSPTWSVYVLGVSLTLRSLVVKCSDDEVLSTRHTLRSLVMKCSDDEVLSTRHTLRSLVVKYSDNEVLSTRHTLRSLVVKCSDDEVLST